MATLVQLSDRQIFDLLVQAYGDAANIPADTTPGSTLSSIFGAIKLLTLQQQQQITVAFNVSRLASSLGGDVDSFAAPFGVPRLSASASTGNVTFGLASAPGAQLLIPAATVNANGSINPGGAVVQTSNGLQFVVVAQPSNAAYSQSLGGYVIAPNATSVMVLVQCTVQGSLGNIQAGQIIGFYNSSVGVPLTSFNNVTNPAAFTNGADFETDPQYKARFTIAVSSGRVATPNAIAAAVLATQPGLTYSIGDMLNASGGAAPGYVTVPVNVAGSGAGPSSTLLNAVQANINAVRSAGITVTAIAPTLIVVAVAGHITVMPGADPGTTLTNADAAVTAYLNGIGLDPAGATTMASYAQVIRVILGVPGVMDIGPLGITLNGATANVSAAFAHQIVSGVVNLSTP